MTREEAIKILQKRQRFCKVISDHANATIKADELQEVEAIDMAISTLRPVSREMVEKVFPGCPACKNGPPKLHIPAFRAMAVCNQHMDHEAFDIELNSKFCLNCGRPLTDKAVDMVMERMEELKDAGD